MYFKLIGGQHAQGDKVYKKGDLVRSKDDLVKKFPNKFEKSDKVDKRDAAEPLQDAPIINAPKGKTIKRVKKSKKDEETQTVTKPTKGAADDGQHDLVEMEDVTDKFPDAADSPLKVYKSKDGYRVVDSEKDDEVLNEEPLEQSQVGPFLDKNLTEE